MINRIDEIRKSVDAGLYQAALSLALTLPDICGQVEYPTAGVGERYRNWIDNYLPGDVLADPIFKKDFETLDSSNIYKLRCSFLHSGNSDIEDSRYKTIDEFHIVAPGTIGLDKKQKPFGYQYETKNYGKYHTIKIDVKYLCDALCDAAEKYYMSKSQSDFEDKTVVIE